MNKILTFFSEIPVHLTPVEWSLIIKALREDPADTDSLVIEVTRENAGPLRQLLNTGGAAVSDEAMKQALKDGKLTTSRKAVYLALASRINRQVPA